MANYNITSYTSPPYNTLTEANSALVGAINAIADSKTLRAINVKKHGPLFMGYVLYDA